MFQQVDFQGAVSPVPVIEISLAPMEEEVPEPRSPFTPSIQSAPYESDSFRPYHLTPPPTMMSHREMRLPRSPLAEEQPKGLASEQFQAMLRATRERNKAATPRKTPDLRKEVALKVHNSRAAERRAIFLSKIAQPPSPSATETPKTPPESPAVFHFTLPSPGLTSPLAMFDDPKSLAKSRQPVRVEEVDFRSALGSKRCRSPPSQASAEQKQMRRRSPPSLAEITAHFSSLDHGLAEIAPSARSPIALPSFLQKQQQQQLQRKDTSEQVMEVRIVVSSAEDDDTAPLASWETAITRALVESPVEELIHHEDAPSVIMADSASTSTEPDDNDATPRTRTGRDMLAMLRRRTAGALRSASVDKLPLLSTPEAERKLRRRSAPGHSSRSLSDISPRPFLKLPGAF